METILDRIVKIADYKHFKIGGLERKIGASKGVLSRAIAQKTDIQAKWIERIVENFPDIDANWLITGHGEMLKSSDGDVITQSGHHNAAAVHGDAIVNGGNDINLMLVNEISEHRRIISKSQEQIDRSQEQIDELIGIIKELAGKLKIDVQKK